MFSVWNTFRGSRSAVAAIRPFVEHSRMQIEFPDSVWLSPYFVGFLGTLITLIASRAVQALDTDELASVQTKSWAMITGMHPALIGSEISTLSAACHPHFTMGCHNACAVFEGLNALEPDCPPELGGGNTLASALWAQYFDAEVAEYLAARHG
jgi:hypothetical protein